MRLQAALTSLLILSRLCCPAQQLTTLADGGNKKASVTERIGLTDVTIHYDRPAVKGREGKIWGGLVPFGFTDQGFGTSKAAPWRAGANECTTIGFSTNVQVEGKSLAAGTYGLFMAMAPGEATIIFSNNHTAWGSFFYNPEEDALRVTVKTIPLTELAERLRYEFSGQQENSAIISLLWERLKIPFTVQVDYVQTQLQSFRKELQGDKGFHWEAWVEAVNFCLQRKTNLEEALQWSDYSINAVFIGAKNFTTLSTKARVLDALNRSAEAEILMKEAMPLGNMTELHNYGRQLIAAKQAEKALAVFKLNAQKHPGEFTPFMGLMRGFSALGDYKTALKHARAALSLAPDTASKEAATRYITLLGEGRDINQ